jgi:hypothetical protein
MADTFGHRFVRARKAYECYACRDPINPGDVYVTWCTVDGAVFWKGKLHTGCADLWRCCDECNDGLGPDWMVDYLCGLSEAELTADIEGAGLLAAEANRIRLLWQGLQR